MSTTELTSEEEGTRNSYDRIALRWVSLHNTPGYWREGFQGFQECLPKGSVLDVGCGGGRDSEFFRGGGYEYVGIDVSSGLLAEARKDHSGMDFREMSMYSLDFLPNSFDGFWAVASLLHIPKDRLHLVLGQVRMVVKSGGIGFIVVKEGKGEKLIRYEEDDERFFAFYEQDEFAGILRGRGFEALFQGRDDRDYNPAKENPTIWLTYIVRVQEG